MNRQQIILLALVVFSAAVGTIQVATWANNTRPSPLRFLSFPPPQMLQGLSKEEQARVIEDWRARAVQEETRKAQERLDLKVRQAWARLLQITDQQWALIEPKNERVQGLWEQDLSWVHYLGRDERSLHWSRPSLSPGYMKGMSRERMPVAWRAVEELLDVIEDPNATDQRVREKIDALQQARANARKALPKARQELAAIATPPRVEAVLLLQEKID